MKGILLSFSMTSVGAVLGKYSKRYNRLKLLMYSRGKYSRLSHLLLHFMPFNPLPFVYHSRTAIFAPFWIVKGSSNTNEALGCKKLNLSDV